MSYKRSLGAASAVDPRYLAQPGAANLYAGAAPSAGGITGSRVLLVAAIGGAAFLLWKKLHKKAPASP